MKQLLSYLLVTFFFLWNIPTLIFCQNIEIDGVIQLKAGAKAGYILQSDKEGVGTWIPSHSISRKQLFVTDFGAKGNGITDDTAAFQAALDSAAILGGTVHVPIGNYNIQQTLIVPAGVKLQGAGISSPDNPNKGSRISFYGSNSFALEFIGDYVGCSNMSIVDVGGQSAGGLNYKTIGGTFGIGASFQDLLILDFFNGTSVQLYANGASGIAWSSFENIHIQNARKGIHIAVADDGSFINLVSFRSIDISGIGFEYGIFIEGPLSNTDWYSVDLKADCPTMGHLVLDTKGHVNIYGIHISTNDPNCADKSTLIELKANTKGSYIHGSAGRGHIIDKGSNYIDLQGESDTGIRPSGNNELLNAAFKGISGINIPYWQYESCIGCSTTPDALEVLAPEWKDQHQVVKITIGAGEMIQLSQDDYYLTKSFHQKECLFGAMIKTDAPDMYAVAYTQFCGHGTSFSSSPHPNDGKWHYIGQLAILDTAIYCSPDPRFILDNRAGGSAAVVYITTPGFVFNRGKKPTLEAGTITSAGGILNGTLSTAMREVESSIDNHLKLAHDGNVFQVSGSAPITFINANEHIFPNGTLLTLLFEESEVQITHNPASIRLLGAANYSSESFSSLKLVSKGDGTWLEVDRNCLNGCVAVNTLKDEAATRSKETASEIVLVQPKQESSDQEVAVKIFPNPTLYGVHIALDSPSLLESYELKILDSRGKLIYQRTIEGRKTWLDFNGLGVSAGTYFLRIKNQKGSVIKTKKIIILKS